MLREFKVEKIFAPKNAAVFCLPSVFEKTMPVDLEIGCGVGYHPIRYAQENPSRFLIAIEHSKERFAKFMSRVEHHPQINNLLPIHSDAVAWITHCMQPNSISRVFILYPNPNPKSASKRWIRMPFMRQILKVLKTNGEIYFASNIKSYIDEVREHAVKDWQLKIINDFSFIKNNFPYGHPRTHFEKKYLERGENCYEIKLLYTIKN